MSLTSQQNIAKNIGTTNKIAGITMDCQSTGTSTTEIEIERRRAVNDLLEQSDFQLINPEKSGPFALNFSIENGLIFIRVQSTGQENRVVALPLSKLYEQLEEYRKTTDDFVKSARSGQIHRMEAIDATRQSIHDQAAIALTDYLSQNIHMDQKTARRLFTLVYVLHIKQSH